MKSDDEIEVMQLHRSPRIVWLGNRPFLKVGPARFLAINDASVPQLHREVGGLALARHIDLAANPELGDAFLADAIRNAPEPIYERGGMAVVPVRDRGQAVLGFQFETQLPILIRLDARMGCRYGHRLIDVCSQLFP